MSPRREGDPDRPGAGDLLGKLQKRAVHGSTDRAAQRPTWHFPPLQPDDTPPAILRGRLVVAATLTLLVIGLAIGSPDSVQARWAQLVLTTAVLTWCAWPFHRAAVRTARRAPATTETLVLVGSSVAYVQSLVNLVSGVGPLRFMTAAAVTTSLLTARFVEGLARDRLRDDERRLAAAQADEVSILRIGPRTRTTSEVRAPARDLVVGDQFIVRPGETVAADGVVVDGSSTTDPSQVTGSGPEDVTVGDHVVAGATNRTRRIVVEARQVGTQTLLGQARALLATAGFGQTRLQQLAERLATWLVPAVGVVAVATVAIRLAFGQPASEALDAAVAVLVAASPASLLLAAPTAALAGAGRAARRGILLRGPEVLDTAGRVDTILLDRTGTVTTGELELKSIAVVGRLSKKAALTAAAGVEQGSDHPVARAIIAGARLARIDLPRIRDFEANRGEGATARIKDTEVTVGKAALFEHVDDILIEQARTHSGTTVFVGWDGRARAALTVQDPVRASSREAVTRLKALGVTPHLLTGDVERSAHEVAEEVGIDPGKVRPEVRASDRVAVVTALQRQGRVVARLGEDGDDESVLRQADLSIVMARSDRRRAPCADVVLLRPELDAVGHAIEVARQTAAVLRRNVRGAAGYHAVAIPLAALGLLPPVAAGVAMALTSIAVLANSMRLQRTP